MAVTRKSIEMNRANKAWEFAQAPEVKGEEKYVSCVKEFPMLVLNCGLINAVAFAYEKGKMATPTSEKDFNASWRAVYNNLADWLGTGEGKANLLNLEKENLMQALLIIGNNKTKLRSTTNETIALFNWLKRFASK